MQINLRKLEDKLEWRFRRDEFSPHPDPTCSQPCTCSRRIVVSRWWWLSELSQWTRRQSRSERCCNAGCWTRWCRLSPKWLPEVDKLRCGTRCPCRIVELDRDGDEARWWPEKTRPPNWCCGDHRDSLHCQRRSNMCHDLPCAPMWFSKRFRCMCFHLKNKWAYVKDATT